jgi:general secretion pathway protein E
MRAAHRLMLFALIASAGGAMLMAATGDSAEPAALMARVRAQAVAAFEPQAWRWLLWSTAIAATIASVLAVLDSTLSPRRASRSMAFEQNVDGGNVREAVLEVRRRIAECTREPRPNIVAAFDELIHGAVSIAASDIHMSPGSDGFRMTYRVHGTLHDVAVLDSSLAPLLATRVKVLARMDTYSRGTPQDGRLVMPVENGSIEARVSTLPTESGDRIVLRLVRGTRTVPDLEGLGFSPEVSERLKELLARPQGLFFVTGPVGAGKTTSLYSALKYIARSRGRTTTLVTLEDPIELELPFATQTQMNAKTGMNFASTLRSVLRQDPNVLMVGEIRDHETAEIASQAGLTGHLILTTVHAESAAGPFARLIEIGIEPFILASATVGSLSQRLVRTLCIACRRPIEPEPLHIDRFGKHGIVLPPGRYYEAVGCDFCEGQGFTGRAPIAELLVVNPRLRQAINERKNTSELYALAVAEGMTPLIRDGLTRAHNGETSLTEVLRVAG